MIVPALTSTSVHNKNVLIHLFHICDRLWEKGAFGAENKNVVFNLF